MSKIITVTSWILSPENNVDIVVIWNAKTLRFQETQLWTRWTARNFPCCHYTCCLSRCFSPGFQEFHVDKTETIPSVSMCGVQKASAYLSIGKKSSRFSVADSKYPGCSSFQVAHAWKRIGSHSMATVWGSVSKDTETSLSLHVLSNGGSRQTKACVNQSALHHGCVF